MGAMVEIAAYLINTIMSLYLIVVLLRMLLQVARADFYNPISQFVVRATDPLVRPLRRIIPGLGGLDLATLVLALMIQFAIINLLYLLLGGALPNPVSALVWSLIGIAAAIVKIYFFSILVAIIFSWVAPGSNHPVLALLNQINEPVMAPVRKLLPPMGGLDLSPILVFILINVFTILLNHAAIATGLPGNLLLAM
jgi:YggT family protein